MSINEKGLDFEVFIAPWVLPKEDIPINIIWNQDFKYDHVKINVPKNLILVDTINLVDYNKDEEEIIILKQDIKRISDQDSFPNFFGLIFRYPYHNFKPLILFKEISISFYNNDEVIKNIFLTAKIFRPKLYNISRIPSIILTDNKFDYDIPIQLLCRGFGFIKTSLNATIKGVEVDFDKTLLERIDSKLKKKYQDYFERKQKDEDTFLDIDQESIEKFLSILDEYKSKKSDINKKITDVFNEEKIEFLLVLDFLYEFFKELKIRNRFENVSLKTPVLKIPKEKFNEFINEILVFVEYTDLKNNKYYPVSIKLDIEDKRTKPQETNVNFQIKIDNIENETFKNVEKIRKVKK